MAIVKHVKSVTLADDANTNLVRPSDWNSDHAITCWDGVSIGGTTNTEGTKTLISSGTFFIAGSNNFLIAKSQNSISFSSRDIYESSYENLLGVELTNLPLTTSAEFHIGCNFMLVEPVDARFVRIPAQFALSQVTGFVPGGWGATTVVGAALYQYFGLGIYSNGTGASSQSLYSVARGREILISQISHSRSNNLQTYTQIISYPFAGSTSEFSTTYTLNTNRVRYETSLLTAFSGIRFVDVNINQKLNAGNYWLFAGYNYSYFNDDTNMTSMTNNGPVASNFYGATVLNSNIGVMGKSNLETGGYMFCGDFSTDGGFLLAYPPDQLNLSQVSSMASHQRLYFQMLRYNIDT